MNGYNGPLLIELWDEEGSLYSKGLVKEICNLLFFKSPVLEHVLIMDLYKKKSCTLRKPVSIVRGYKYGTENIKICCLFFI